jgi:hypothetical protein
MEKSVKSNYMLIGLMLAASLVTSNGYAAKVVLSFEGIGDLAAVNDFYNFGVDSEGNTGTDYGISFSNSAFGIIDTDLGNLGTYSGYFANGPSPHTALIFREGGSATLNVEEGFDSSFSLFYSSSADAIVRIYDGLDGTGKQLAVLNLVTNFTNENCRVNAGENDIYCHWDQTGVSFRGKAKSVVFDGPREFTFYDDITLGSDEQRNCKRLRKNRRCNDDHPGIFKCDRKEFKEYSRWPRNNRYSKWHD